MLSLYSEKPQVRWFDIIFTGLPTTVFYFYVAVFWLRLITLPFPPEYHVIPDPPPFFPAITSDWPLIVIHFTFSVTVLLYLSNRICHLLLRVFTDLSATYGTTDFVTAACLQEPSSFRTNLFRKKKVKKKRKKWCILRLFKLWLLCIFNRVVCARVIYISVTILV